METKDKNKGGRPKGRKKISKIEVSIEPEIKIEFMRLLHEEGKNASCQICEWIREYIRQHKEETI